MALPECPTLQDWNAISEDTQLALSTQALLAAADAIARQAEVLAEEMETGTLFDRGGPDALRLLAALVRTNRPSPLATDGWHCAAGHA